MIRRGEGGWVDAGRALMVARVLFPVLTCRGNAITPPAPGDHQGPPFPASSALAPTDHPASYLSSRLRLMPITADYEV